MSRGALMLRAVRERSELTPTRRSRAPSATARAPPACRHARVETLAQESRQEASARAKHARHHTLDRRLVVFAQTSKYRVRRSSYSNPARNAASEEESR